MDTNIPEKDKNVDKPYNDSIGCSAAKEKQKKFPSSQGVNWQTLSVGLLLGGFIALAIVVVWANFCSRTESKDTPVNVQLTIKDVKDIEKTDGNAIDKVLQTTAEKAFYQGRKEAQNEFDKNFTTLLTILTIFGIAWPLIIALLQFKFSEKEIEKINAADRRADEIEVQIQKAKNDLCNSKTQWDEVQTKITKTNINLLKTYEALDSKAIFSYSLIGRLYENLADITFSEMISNEDICKKNYIYSNAVACYLCCITPDMDRQDEDAAFDLVCNTLKKIIPEEEEGKYTYRTKISLESIQGQIKDIESFLAEERKANVSWKGSKDVLLTLAQTYQKFNKTGITFSYKQDKEI